MAQVDIINTTRRPTPRFAYAKVAAAVLPGWDISLAFLTSAKAKRMNEELRKKSYVPNVLSYAVGESSGEIAICLEEAARQAPNYEMSERRFVLYLFIHALLHLKGWPHGATMERWEQKLLARFVPQRTRTRHGSANNDGHRHRHLPGQGSRR